MKLIPGNIITVRQHHQTPMVYSQVNDTIFTHIQLSKDKSLRVEVSGCFHALEERRERSKKHCLRGGEWPFRPEAPVEVHPIETLGNSYSQKARSGEVQRNKVHSGN